MLLPKQCLPNFTPRLLGHRAVPGGKQRHCCYFPSCWVLDTHRTAWPGFWPSVAHRLVGGALNRHLWALCQAAGTHLACKPRDQSAWEFCFSQKQLLASGGCVMEYKYCHPRKTTVRWDLQGVRGAFELLNRRYTLGGFVTTPLGFCLLSISGPASLLLYLHAGNIWNTSFSQISSSQCLLLGNLTLCQES